MQWCKEKLKNKQTKIFSWKKASLSYLQMHLATFFLPIKILSFFLLLLFLTVVKLLSDPLSECLYQKTNICSILTVLPSVQYIVNCAYLTTVIHPSCHGIEEFTYSIWISVKSQHDSRTQFDSITMVEYVFISCFVFPFKNTICLTMHWTKPCRVEKSIALSEMQCVSTIRPLRPKVVWY